MIFGALKGFPAGMERCSLTEMIPTRPLLAAAGLALIAACAGPQWTKPGADASVISRDVDECRGVALKRASPAAAPSTSTEATTDRGRSGTPMSISAGSNERYIDEREEVHRCMLTRGYQLRRPD